MEPFPEVDNVCAIAIDLPGFSDLITANVYAVGSGPLTLIDAAPKFPGSFETLKGQLEQAGRDLTDIERIIFTHGHVDHFGLAARIREEVGRPIPCFVHAEDAWRVTVETYREEMFDPARSTVKVSAWSSLTVWRSTIRRARVTSETSGAMRSVLRLSDHGSAGKRKPSARALFPQRTNSSSTK